LLYTQFFLSFFTFAPLKVFLCFFNKKFYNFDKYEEIVYQVIPVSLVCPDPVVGHAGVEADVAGVHLASQVARSLGEQLPEICRE
jgi:hypothetical protein